MCPVIGSCMSSSSISFSLMNTGSSVATVVESLYRKKSSTVSCGDLLEFFGCEFKASFVSSGVMFCFCLGLFISREEHLGPLRNISLSSDLSNQLMYLLNSGRCFECILSFKW